PHREEDVVLALDMLVVVHADLRVADVRGGHRGPPATSFLKSGMKSSRHFRCHSGTMLSSSHGASASSSVLGGWEGRAAMVACSISTFISVFPPCSASMNTWNPGLTPANPGRP